MKVEKGEFLIDGGDSAMMTMRRRPLTDRSRLEQYTTEHRAQSTQLSPYKNVLSSLVTADRGRLD